MPEENIVPGLSTDLLPSEFQRYQQLNPEFQEPLSRRAEAMLQALVREKGKDLPEREVGRRVGVFHERLLAVVPQIEENPLWMAKLGVLPEKRVPDSEGVAADVVRKQYEAARDVRVASSDAEFSKSSRTFLKTVLEILVAPVERMALEKEMMEGNPIDVSNIVIDPTRITPTLLDNLGLSQFKASKGSSPEEKVMAYSRAIPAIKEMLNHLEPFQLSQEQNRSKLHYFRLMRIGAGENEGYLLGTQNIAGKKVLFKTDIHGAGRRVDNIADNYAEEMAKLGKIADMIQDLDRQMATRWQEIKGTSEMEEMKARLFECVDSLTFVTNPHKVRIRKLIEGCLTLQTTTTRAPKYGTGPDGKRTVLREAETRQVYNPGAVRAQWNAAREYVGLRQTEISRIRKYLVEDQTRIQHYLSQQQGPFDRFHDTVDKLHAKFRILDTDKPMTLEDAAHIRVNLLKLKDECAREKKIPWNPKVDFFEPYLTFADQMVEHIEATLPLLREEDPAKIDRKAAASEFMKIYMVTKVERAYKGLQAVHDQYFRSDDPKPNFQAMIEAMDEVGKKLYEKRVDETIEGELIPTPEYYCVVGEIYHLINSLRKKANAGIEAMNSTTPENALKIRQLMRDQLRDFRFDELLDRQLQRKAPATRA